jgi:tetratricopeptide (TPR) repeat protein
MEAAEPEERALTEAARAHPTDAAAQAALGRYWLKQRRPYAAMWAFEDAMDLRRDDPQLRLDLARALIVAHLPREALRLLTRSHDASPRAVAAPPEAPDVEERQVAAAAYLAMGDPVGAVGMLATVGPAHPRSAAALLDLGNAYEALGDDLSAGRAYQLHLQQAPESVEGLLALGRLATRQQRWSDALALLAQAHRAAPDDPRPLVRAALALQARGGPAAESDAPTGAIGLLRRVLQSHPDDGPAHLQLGLWRLRHARPAEAVRDLEAARAAGAGGDEVRLRLAGALAASGQKAEASYQRGVYDLETRQPRLALREFQRMALLDPARPQAAVMIATAYARMDETGQAAEAARRGLERHPDDPQLLALRAKMLVMADDRTAATQLCRRWQAQYPNAAEPYFVLAGIERAALHSAEAARLAEEAITRDPNHADYCLEAARAYAAIATPDALRRGAERAQRAITLSPDDARAPAVLADLLRRLGDLDGARRQYERAMDLDPGARQGAIGLLQLCPLLGKSARVAFYGDIVRALQERGDAAGPLWRRVDRTPGDADAHARLAQLLLEAGDLRQARYALERATALRPNDRKLAQQRETVKRLLALREP